MGVHICEVQSSHRLLWEKLAGSPETLDYGLQLSHYGSNVFGELEVVLDDRSKQLCVALLIDWGSVHVEPDEPPDLVSMSSSLYWDGCGWDIRGWKMV